MGEVSEMMGDVGGGSLLGWRGRLSACLACVSGWSDVSRRVTYQLGGLRSASAHGGL